MFNYFYKVAVTNAPAAIIDLVSESRRAIIRHEEGVISGHLIVKLNDVFSLSIVNNSHAFEDEWEGAATLEIALLKNGRILKDSNGCNELTIVNGIDYHRLAQLFKQIIAQKSGNVFHLWTECFKLEDSRYPDFDEDVLRLDWVEERFDEVRKAIHS